MQQEQEVGRPVPSGFDIETLNLWITRRARDLGLEAEPVSAPYPKLEQMLLRAAPAVVRVLLTGNPYFVLLIGARYHKLRVLGPDLREHEIGSELLWDALVAPYIQKLPTDIDGCLQGLGIASRRYRYARQALLQECLRFLSVGGCWLLRPALTGSWFRVLRRDRLGQRLFIFMAAYITSIGFTLGAWALIGNAAFTDRGFTQWLWAAVLALFTVTLLQLISAWSAGLITLDFGTRLKQRLLVGALQLPQEAVRLDGAGHHLGRVVESSSFEAVLLTGTVTGVVAVLELGVAAVVLSYGAGGFSHALLLLAWCLLGTFLLTQYHRRRRAWTDVRLTMTHRLVERLLGQQTRLAQEQQETWHQWEDQELEAYLAQATRMDRAYVWLTTLQTRGWLVFGSAGLGSAFLNGATSPTLLAVGLGGILLAQRALLQLATSAVSLIDAWIGWRTVKPLFTAARQHDTQPHASVTAALLEQPAVSPAEPEAKATDPASSCRLREMLLEACDLQFAYARRAEVVLRDCTIAVHRGDRILLDGPSGSGKSTFAAVLAGLRESTGGLLLYRGLDRRTLGNATWRQRIVLVPQFHENYILSGTLAFNLLLGRQWPASPQDLAEAEALCHELELGGLLARMPSGIQQIIGETGWQLSHGERSRVYLARALLQDADILILDESFAALDPETLQVCMRVLLAKAGTVILIAHP